MPSTVKVCHLESRLQMGVTPRSPEQITFIFDSMLNWNHI